MQSCLGSSSSRDKAEEVKKPHIGLKDIWSAYEEWSNYAVGVPLSLKHTRSNVTQYYVPTLSAIQIFTNKSGSSSRSFGTDCHLYFQYNETMRFDDRPPLILKVDELAKKHRGLNSLTSSDLSHRSWFSVAWSPLYQIPEVRTVKALSVSFLTYHSLTPFFPEIFPQDAKVVLPAFGVVTSKHPGKVWIMPGTSDQENLNIHEESAASWLGEVMFRHNDFELFMAEKANDLPLPSGW
ncbi:hypothetical protein EUTSA_v10014556mg [Eutrema salsugineum]|uniref:Uncharacterized protein n=1 Tax=Eutrema salsugineum TaxID=72664 RepID=V4KS62_EUTSA|nr:uncharacterized protein LOC18017734 [Eutrema salsugineum]ESQ40780.1 hypothetical protein EUTSA_v10014556mg [Eutrema salsugineum]